MRVVIGYESMYGNTHRIADAIGSGFDRSDDVTVTPISRVDLGQGTPDVLILGVPTHAHGLPRPSTRRAALDASTTRYEQHDVDESAGVESGLREWLRDLPANVTTHVATFDTRFRPPGWLVGHPARQVRRTLVRHGARSLAQPQSFFVDKHEQLLPGELERATAWGAQLRAQLPRTGLASPR